MDILIKELEKIKIQIGEKKLAQFKIYMDYLMEYNSHTNLTAIVQPEQILIKHFFDSLVITKFLDIKSGDTFIDVGTGAGFPGVPIKIAFKDINLTLMDSSNKKVAFLKKLIEKLAVEAEIFRARAEELGLQKSFREKFDFAVSRAVAPLNILAEYCLSLVKPSGFFVAMKGPSAQEEISNAESAIKILGGKVLKIETFKLPQNSGTRSIVIIQKTKNTPNIYPRSNSKISKIPL